MTVPVVPANSNLYNYDYFQNDDVCRLCWNRNAFIDIFLEELNNTQEIKKTLSNKIKECLEIDLSLSLIPKKVCEECCSQIEKFYLFKVFCQQTNKKLCEIFENYCEEAIKIEPTNNEEEFYDVNSLDEYESCARHSEETRNVPKKRVRQVKSNRYKLKRSPTYCNICRINLETKDNFEKHNFNSHGIENGTFKCFGCDKRFKTRNACLGHEIKFCKGLSEGYKCSICSRFLPSRKIYESHMRDHRENASIKLPEDIFKCKQCNKLFKTKHKLMEHVSEHGVKKKMFVCETCGRVFTRQDYLYKHKLTHTGVKHHVCPHCNFRATQRSSLVVHIRKHTGERPYSCDVCSQRCVSSSNLRAHRRRHLDIKQHKCTICGKKFGYKDTLAEHICAEHSPATPQPCPQCPARYSRPKALRRHLRAKHGQDGKNLTSDAGQEPNGHIQKISD